MGPSHNVYHKNREKLKDETDYSRENFSYGENPERYLLKTYAVTIIICNGDNATQSIFSGWYKFNNSQENNQPLNQHGQNTAFGKKWKSTGVTHSNNKKKKSRYRIII